MSNATLAVYGRLGSDPREHATRKGGAMATASLAVDIPDRSRDAEETDRDGGGRRHAGARPEPRRADRG